MSARKRKRKKLTSEQLWRKLKLKHLEAKKRLSKKHPKVERFFKARGLEPEKIREHSAKILGVSAITGALLLSPQARVEALPTSQEIISKLKALIKEMDKIAERTAKQNPGVVLSEELIKMRYEQ